MEGSSATKLSRPMALAIAMLAKLRRWSEIRCPCRGDSPRRASEFNCNLAKCQCRITPLEGYDATNLFGAKKADVSLEVSFDQGGENTKSRLPFGSPCIQIIVEGSRCVEIRFTESLIAIRPKVKIHATHNAEDSDLTLQPPIGLGDSWYLKEVLMT
jgi:hypothetical protein